MTNSNDDVFSAAQFGQLKRTLQALAMPPSEQLALFPDSAIKPDQLALEFNHWLAVVRAEYEAELSSSQVQALAAIDEKLSIISRDGVEFDAELWTDAAVRSSPQWEHVRGLASAALEAFGWVAVAESREEVATEGSSSG